MISKDKNYKTRNGKQVRIYSLDGLSSAEVHGAYKEDYGWRPWSWDLNGKSSTREDWLCRQWDENFESDWDLIEFIVDKNNI